MESFKVILLRIESNHCMSELLIISEHTKSIFNLNLPKEESFEYFYSKKRRNEVCLCFRLHPKESGHFVESSFFIGIDWIDYPRNAIYVEPKLNSGTAQTDYLKMLFCALKHPEVAKYSTDLFEIKFDYPKIKITQEQDLLTPLLVVQFLSVVKVIVQKGLKKSYYRVDQNLYSRVKGKALVSSTIKQNLLKNKPLHTHCSFDEFGLNGLENRLIKKAMTFVKRYLPTTRNLPKDYVQHEFNYIIPAFELVSEDVSLNDIKQLKNNAFYKEYEEAIRLAKLILQRFGYNITNIQKSDTVQTPPFWIDMSKLFELYVLGLLKDRSGDKQVKYHYTISGNELDYLLNTPDYQMVIDAKYKAWYAQRIDNEDIRQVSGYARNKYVYRQLCKNDSEIIDCLIIYPDINCQVNNLDTLDLRKTPIEQYVRFYKLAVRLPVLSCNVK